FCEKAEDRPEKLVVCGEVGDHRTRDMVDQQCGRPSVRTPDLPDDVPLATGSEANFLRQLGKDVDTDVEDLSDRLLAMLTNELVERDETTKLELQPAL